MSYRRVEFCLFFGYYCMIFEILTMLVNGISQLCVYLFTLILELWKELQYSQGHSIL